MYVVIKTSENDSVYHYVRMVTNNGIATNDLITNAIVVSTSAIATKLCDVCTALDSDGTYEVRQVVLEEIS